MSSHRSVQSLPFCRFGVALGHESTINNCWSPKEELPAFAAAATPKKYDFVRQSIVNPSPLLLNSCWQKSYQFSWRQRPASNITINDREGQSCEGLISVDLVASKTDSGTWSWKTASDFLNVFDYRLDYFRRGQSTAWSLKWWMDSLDVML